jgi:hypothetical protein
MKNKYFKEVIHNLLGLNKKRIKISKRNARMMREDRALRIKKTKKIKND